MYFYRDSGGTIKKYTYCTICGSGPYTDKDENAEYISVGAATRIVYCRKCVRERNYSVDSSLPISKSLASLPPEEKFKRKFRVSIHTPQDSSESKKPEYTPVVFEKQETEDPVPERIKEDLIPVLDPDTDPVLDEIAPIEDPVLIEESVVEPPKKSVKKSHHKKIVSEKDLSLEEPIKVESVVTPEINTVTQKNGKHVNLCLYEGADGSYIVVLLKDVAREHAEINLGTNDKFKPEQLPADIVYVREILTKDADREAVNLRKANRDRKERYIKEYFERC